MVFLGTQTNHVETFPLFIRHRIRAYLLESGLQPAVDGVVVGGELDDSLLPGAQKSDVLRTNFCFNQQGVIQRHDFHNIVTWLNNAADGVDHQLLNDTAYRRGDERTVNPILNRLSGSFGFAEVGTCFVEL